MTVPDRVLDAHRALAVALEPVTDAQVAEPSRLPGWTRGHVLAHVAGVTGALARQAEFAVKGELTEVYQGGRPQRDADIETYSGRSADEHRAAIADAVRRLEAAWSAVNDWSLPVAYRDGDLSGTASALWREVVIHTRDLDLATDHAWSPEFVDDLVAFLEVRVPDGVTLKATDDRARDLNGGGPVLEGTARDLALWLAGREPDGAVTGSAPELRPWP